METSKIYARVPLELSIKQIRLVELLSGNNDEVIQCRFHCISLLDCPEYVALSYAWGPPKAYKNIVLNDTDFAIRRNLWWFLYHARTRKETQLLWIDALCIDQSNDSERSHQVGLMGKIYSAAASVAVWLGEADKEAESDLAMDFVDRKGLAPLRIKAGRFQSLWSPSQGRALLSLCERNYWKRVWVLQEIMHAKYLTVFCGSKNFPWQNILQIFLNLKIIVEIGHAVHLYNAAVIFDSPASAIIKAKSAWHGQRIPLWDLLETYRDFQSTEVRDKVIGLLGLESGGELSDEGSLIALVDYSIPLIEFFWRTLSYIWVESCLFDRGRMTRTAESLKEILKVYGLDTELSKKINASDLLLMMINRYSLSSPAIMHEECTRISDPAEQRRIQNRSTQRNLRKKLKKRLEDLERRAASSSASPQPKTIPKQYTPPNYPPLLSIDPAPLDQTWLESQDMP